MDAALVIDKPQGMTSHDVVNRVRRILRERSAVSSVISTLGWRSSIRTSSDPV